MRASAAPASRSHRAGSAIAAARLPASSVSETDAANAEVSASGADSPRDQRDRHPRLGGERGDVGGGFARGGLPVERALTRHHDGCRRQRSAKVDELRDLGSPRDDPRPPGEQPEAHSSGSPGSRSPRIGGQQPREPGQAGIRAEDCGLAQALLRSEDSRRAEGAEQGVRHVAEHEHAFRGQGAKRRQVCRRHGVEAAGAERDRGAGGIRESGAERGQHARAAIGRRAAADAEHESRDRLLKNPVIEGGRDRLAEPDRVRVEREHS